MNEVETHKPPSKGAGSTASVNVAPRPAPVITAHYSLISKCRMRESAEGEPICEVDETEP